jgi:hypothetical protein
MMKLSESYMDHTLFWAKDEEELSSSVYTHDNGHARLKLGNVDPTCLHSIF